MKKAFGFIVVYLLFLLSFNIQAKAKDTFIFAGAQLTLPEGWSIKESGRMATLLPSKKGAFIEVYRFSKVPEADIKVITDILKPRKNTTDIVVTKAIASTQHSLNGILAEGIAKIKNTPVRFKIIALPIGSYAVLAVSFVAEKEISNFQKDIDNVLGSLKVHP